MTTPSTPSEEGPSARLERLHAESSELLRNAMESQGDSFDLLDNTQEADPNDFPLQDESTIDQLLHEQEDDDDNDVNNALFSAPTSPIVDPNDLQVQDILMHRNRPERGRVAYHWNLFLQSTYPILLLLMVLLLWPAGFFALRNLIPKTDSTFHTPIPGSPSSAAQQIVQVKFPQSADSSTHPTLLVVLQLNEKSNTTLIQHTYAREVSLGLQSYLNNQLSMNTTNSTVRVSSYYGYQQRNLSLLAQSFLSKDQRTTFLQVVPQFRDVHSIKQHLTVVMDTMDEYFEQDAPDDLDIGFTGLNYFSRDLRATTKEDLKRMDTLVLPLALVLVGMTLLSRRSQIFCCWTSRDKIQMLFVLLLPLCSMISTVSTWSIIMNSFVISRMQITQFTPSIMMSLTLGMGIDYTLFLVARFLSEAHSSTFHAVQIMLEQAGQVVMVSGTTLLCTFAALIALPLPMLQSVGVGAAVAIASAMLMNLLVIPSLLYTPLVAHWLQPQSRVMPSTYINVDPTEPLLNHSERANPSRGLHDHPCTEVIQDTIWIRLARQVLHPYKSIIIVLVILQFLLWPVAWNSRRLDSSDLSFESLLPKDAPSLQAYYKLVDGGHFGPGKLAPFRIVLDGSKSNTTIDTPEAFDLQHDLVQTILHNNTSAGASFVGVSVANNVPIPYSVYLAAKSCDPTRSSNQNTACSNDALRCLHVLDQEMTSSDRFATYILVELQSSPPFNKEGITWLDETRLRIDKWSKAQRARNNSATMDVCVDGPAAIAHDAVNAVYSSFPKVLISTLVVVFVLLGFVFQSILPPIRSIVSISFTLVVSFGLAVLVYQDGILYSWHIRSFVAVDPELSWLVPILTFSIIVGLALDYDIFLVTRIFEFRWLEGYGHESSIAAGLDATGGIITSAGIIMALSFGSLLASQSPALDQWAFLVTVAVLLDTFVVRTLLVPAMMGWTGPTFSWYPRRVPCTTMRIDGLDVLDENNVSSSLRIRREHLQALLLDSTDDGADEGRYSASERRETLCCETVEQSNDLNRSPF